jgi:DNA-binding HxlR family transcriptional regulator
MDSTRLPSIGMRAMAPKGTSEAPPPGCEKVVGCDVAELFALLGQPHVLRLLHLLVESRGTPMRFSEIEDRLKISPKTLSARLRTLVEAGFLTRHAYNEIPPRVEYEATGKALELGELFPILGRWATRNSMTAVPVVSTVGRVPERAAAAGS